MALPQRVLGYQSTAGRQADARRRRESTWGGREVRLLGKPLLYVAVGCGIWFVAVVAGTWGAADWACVAVVAAGLPVTLVGLVMALLRIDSDVFLDTMGGLLLAVATGAASLISAWVVLASIDYL